MQEIELIGRDKLLKQVYMSVQTKKPPFVLLGDSGVGISRIFEWAVEHVPENTPKALISGTMTPREMLMVIVQQWRLELCNESNGKSLNPQRAKVTDLERAVNGVSGKAMLFIDNFQFMSASKLHKCKTWNDKFTVFYAGSPPFKHEIMKYCLIGKIRHKIKPLDQQSALRLAQLACQKHKSSHSPKDVARLSGGYPATIFNLAKGSLDHVPKEAQERGREFNIGFVYLILFAGLISLRFIGRGTGSTSIYLLGGFAMVTGILFRYWFFKRV